MKVPLLDLKPQYETLKDEIQKAIAELSATQMFILGPHVVEFEEKPQNTASPAMAAPSPPVRTPCSSR